MARTVRQKLPSPPPVYDQEYIADLVQAVNQYMLQREAAGEMIAARYVITDPVAIPGDLPDTSTLPTGALYLAQIPGAPAGTKPYLTVVTKGDK